MECQNWIKLWRQTKENNIWLNDNTAWRIFEYLLMTVDYKTGKWSTGRFVIAQYLKMKEGTVYDALRRLQKNKMISLNGNNHFTTISICNWSKYQALDNNQTTTRQQPDNTNKEIKNKEVYSENTIKIAELMELKPTKGLERYLNELYPNHLFKEMTITMLQWCEDKKLKPTIGRWMAFARKGTKEGTVQTKQDLGLEEN